MRPASHWLSAAFGVGLLLVFLGERAVGEGAGRTALSGLGVLTCLAAFGLRTLRFARAAADRRAVERSLCASMAVGLVGLAVYFLQSDAGAKLFGAPLSRSSPNLASALFALFPVLIAFCVLPLLLGELAYAAMARAPAIESARVHDAWRSGLGLASVLTAAFALAYVASARDAKWDLSYFRTAKAGDATRRIVEALDEPVDVSLFFPPANEVKEQVLEYLGDLTKLSPKLQVHSYDQAVDPALAKKLGVSGNGTLVVAKGARKELFSLGTDLERSRGELRDFDRQFQKRLLLVAKTKTTIYFTTGHGERQEMTTDPTDRRWVLHSARELLAAQNHDLKDLSAANGLATEIPKDAGLVAIVGPQKPFLPEELQALGRYLEHGGRLFVALDPESGLDFHELLEPYGLKFVPETLANDAVYVQRTHEASDRATIATADYSSHPSVTTLGRAGRRAPIILSGAGHLEPLEKRPPQTQLDFTIRAEPRTWNDLNNNYQFDPPAETRKAWNLAAAVTRTPPKGSKDPEARLFVLADADALGDPAVEYFANGYLAVDATKWLLGEEAMAGETTSEEDTPIQHTRKQDVAWFYSSVFAAPVLVLALGAVFTRRRSTRLRKGQEAAR